ncbi:NAD-dependent protein deacetylase [Thalassobacillus devorans]|uniref:protein acetyllysine N-acetyltransferase n=1 Tax=Thalassobacillus devorans TaxID=279813 RepID=A0ABQ1NKD0_9BACI|nr:NAD-dependent protein deacylase [Thalassobacillus devorans]NIK27642.1 NAD-dependent deacetylase [Thalassobacillus devorans]GGC79362.1 NAD-dependent protein deacetylase [Thalassobacillus devorans]
MNHLDQIAKIIQQANSVAILTGAGVSTASGIPDFRSSEGLWTEDHAREYYMSSQYFFKDPVDFWNKYKRIFRLKLLKNYQPNKVHQFFKRLEDAGKDVAIITQNVDGLHQLAGNSRVVEYHGTLNQASCPSCQASYSLDYVMENEIPYCQEPGCGDILKPDVVLFGDMITAHDEAEAILDHVDVLLVMGTSLFVTPFNLLPEYAAYRGIPAIMINGEPTGKDYLFNHVIHDDLSKVVRELSPLID